MGYQIRSYVIGLLQSDGSIRNPKRMNKLIYIEFLHFRQSLLKYLHKLSFIYTGDLMPIEDESISFQFFLTFRTLFASFRLEN